MIASPPLLGTHGAPTATHGLAVGGPGTVAGLVRWVAVGLVVLLVGTAVLTLAKSAWERRRETRRQSRAADLRVALAERLGRDDPDAASWVADLSSPERDVLADVVARHLDIVEGEDRATLLTIASALGMADRARSMIETGGPDERLRGLRRLASLGTTVELDWLAPRLGDTRQEREAAVPVVGIESSADRRAVVEFLFEHGPLSLFGLDAAAAVLEPDPTPLFRWLEETDTDDAATLGQALLVLDRLEGAHHDVSLDGVIACLDHDDERVRWHACLVLGAFGWRADLESRVDIDALLADPSPRVRIAAYRMLDAWGDAAGRTRLRQALAEESHDRARLVCNRVVERTPPETVLRLVPADRVSAELAAWTPVESAVVRRNDPLT